MEDFRKYYFAGTIIIAVVYLASLGSYLFAGITLAFLVVNYINSKGALSSAFDRVAYFSIGLLAMSFAFVDHVRQTVDPLNPVFRRIVFVYLGSAVLLAIVIQIYVVLSRNSSILSLMVYKAIMPLFLVAGISGSIFIAMYFW